MKKKNFACGDEVLRQANLNIQSSYCLAMFIGQEIFQTQYILKFECIQRKAFKAVVKIAKILLIYCYYWIF